MTPKKLQRKGYTTGLSRSCFCGAQMNGGVDRLIDAAVDVVNGAYGDGECSLHPTTLDIALCEALSPFTEEEQERPYYVYYPQGQPWIVFPDGRQAVQHSDKAAHRVTDELNRLHALAEKGGE